jgi:enterochelin esterase-like enzyme
MIVVGAMSVISWGFLTGLGAAAVVAWAGCWTIHRRRQNNRRSGRRRGRRVIIGMVATLALVLSLASAADAVNAHYQYMPRVADVVGERTWPTANVADLTSPRPSIDQVSRSVSGRTRPTRSHPRGAVVKIHVNATGVGFDGDTVLVYLPPQYFTDHTAHFPVVYLLHGSPGIPIDWLRGGDAAHAAFVAATENHPQILAIPPASRNWLDDSECVDGVHTRVETYLIHDVVPAVDAQLRTLPDAAHRTVAGMSAGGYCALNLGLRNRTVFGSIVDMSGYTHPTHAGGMAALFGHRADLQQVVAANSPDIYVNHLTPTPPTRLYLLCGTDDGGALRQMAAMRDRLRTRGFPVTWVTRPGGHTYGVWRPGLVSALTWTPN